MIKISLLGKGREKNEKNINSADLVEPNSPGLGRRGKYNRFLDG
jgi:hypothetical protein